MQSQDRLLVPGSRLKAAKVAGIGVLFIAAGVWLFRRPDAASSAIGVASAVFGIVCGGYGLYRLIRPGIAVLLDSDGLVDRASATGVGRIRWDEIDTARVYVFMGQTMVGIVPRDVDGFLSRQPRWRRSLLRANLGLGCAPVNIPEVILAIPATSLLSAMERFAGRTWLT